MQRSGCTGRKNEGKCHKLYETSDYKKWPYQAGLEIARNDFNFPMLM